MLTDLVKMKSSINFEYLLPLIKRITKYVIIRGIGVGVYLGMLVLLVEVIKINPVISAAITATLTSAYLYFFSYVWVFKSKKNSHAYSLPRFISIEILTLLMNTGIMYLVVNVFNWEYVLGVIIGAVVIPLISFLLNFFWAFNKK